MDNDENDENDENVEINVIIAPPGRRASNDAILWDPIVVQTCLHPTLAPPSYFAGPLFRGDHTCCLLDGLLKVPSQEDSMAKNMPR